MGAGISKPNGDAGVIIPRRPFVTKLESFKRRRNARRTKNLSTLSTKELLDCDDDSMRESICSADCQKNGAESVESDKDSIARRKEIEGAGVIAAAVPGEEREGRNGDGKKVDEDSEGRKMEKGEVEKGDENRDQSCEEEKTEERGVREKRGEDRTRLSKIKMGKGGGERANKEEEEEAGKFVGNQIGSGDFPGSPSFREYYFASVQGDDRSEENDENKDDDKKANYSDSHEGSMCKSKDKGKRLRAIVKGPVAVCGLLNMRSCYHSSPSTDSPRLLGEKTS